MLAYFLFVALTNLALGAYLGYCYGPLFATMRKTAAPAGDHGHTGQPTTDTHPPAHAETPAGVTPTVAAEPASLTSVAAAATDALAVTAAPAEDLRPVKQTGSREVSAVDLADVMSELGVAPPEPAAAAPAETVPAPAAAPVPAPIAATPDLALASEAAPLAG